MIFWICLTIFIGGLIWCIYSDWENGCGIVTLAIGAAAILISSVILLTSYLGLDGTVAENKIRYESLVYQYENDIYDNDNDLGKRELMVDIQEWNEYLAWFQANHDDLWIGIFIPDIFDQFDYIRLNKTTN